ncbi:MAG: DNA starvation/stationary phase protection protein Dps [Deltaproteobacteria bacterium]|nr:DNA starvation/stationary phase protection protein Dps [Deltaproteobacteria bacterium]
MRKTYPAAVKVSNDTKQKIVELINPSLARTIDLFLEAKHAHWNSKGKQFYSLHLLFDVVAKHLRKQADDLGERVASLGGVAQGTVQEVARTTDLQPYELGSASVDDHVSAIVENLAQHASALRKAIDRTEEIGDLATQEILLTHLCKVEQDTWLLESHLADSRPPIREREERAAPGGNGGRAAARKHPEAAAQR